MLAATKVSVEALSPRFDEWLRRRFAEPLKGVGAWRDSTVTPSEIDAAIEAGKNLQRAGQLNEAIAAFERADKLFPEMADRDSPAWYLAELYRGRGDLARAVQYYSRVTRLSESHLAANRHEAAARAQLKDPAGALAALERAIYIHPYEIALHEEAATAAASAGNHRRAVLARRAIVALRPSDRAGAWYELAVALRNAGDRAGARREVLKALEEAPSFEKAQVLLLELKRGGS
jgi:cellulose synthase operon protein C